MIEKLNPIGIGTYKLDLENKKETLDGLLYSFRKGQNYISTSLMYSDCAIVDFLKEFFNKINREDIFVMSHLEKYIEKKSDVEKQVDEYLKRMGIEYIDALQIHTPEVCKLSLLDVYYEMKKVQEKGKVRYLSTSNTSFEQLKELQNNFGIYSFEGVYNLDCKIYENIGLVEYCKENNIKFICYQALRRNKIAEANYDFLVKMAEKYNKTQNQILINWMLKAKGLYTLIKTTQKEYIDSNLESLDFDLEEEDIKILNDFQNEKYNSIKIDWDANRGGVTIDKLASQ